MFPLPSPSVVLSHVKNRMCMHSSTISDVEAIYLYQSIIQCRNCFRLKHSMSFEQKNTLIYYLQQAR
ncbi:hypothetical protein AL507_01500 [Providencia stuartii]|nr:hypothetical protein AL507_01500 [Providencia stuartii]